MSGLQVNSITGAGSAAAASVAEALVPKRTSAQAAARATGAASGATAKDAAAPTTADSGSNITANDFLTLLVSELKNQDPTQPTDPNAYLSQLVGVNSLQQLISINQDLTPTTPSSGS